jgi:hypothetical protein
MLGSSIDILVSGANLMFALKPCFQILALFYGYTFPNAFYFDQSPMDKEGYLYLALQMSFLK